MTTGDVKRTRLRRDDVCGCGATVSAGTMAGWDRVSRTVLCPRCVDGTDAPSAIPAPRLAEPDRPAIASGAAGGSAQAEYERRKSRREARIRTSHPRIGGLLLAMTSEPKSTTVWASGAEGERRVAARLVELCGDDVLLLHDRRIPLSRANIDHIAVGPAGVYVIDAKHYDNAKVEIRRSGGLLRPVVEQLYVRGRDRTTLVTGLVPQVAAVQAALARFDPSVPVSSLLCFVDSLLPMFRSLEMKGVPIVGPKRAAELLRRPGPFDAAARECIHRHLVRNLRPAAST